MTENEWKLWVCDIVEHKKERDCVCVFVRVHMYVL